jgi:hypothetical protein
MIKDTINIFDLTVMNNLMSSGGFKTSINIYNYLLNYLNYNKKETSKKS